MASISKLKKKRRQKMIKPEDLRIGDLVRVGSNKCMIPEGTVCAVTQISLEWTYKDYKGVVTLSYTDGTDDESWGIWCSNIEGLPLTPEIFEKNGFKTIDPGRCYTKSMGDTSRYLKRYVAVERKCNNWAVFLKYESAPDSILIRHIKHVHELQHILWVLGFDASMIYPSLEAPNFEAFLAHVEDIDDELSNRILEFLNDPQ